MTYSGNSPAKTSKKKMRLARRSSIATDTSSFNSQRRKTKQELTRTTDDVEKLARIEAKLNRERDALKDTYDDAVDRGLDEVLIQKLANDLEAKTAELEQVRNVYNTAGKSVLYTYYARQLRESTRFTSDDTELQANLTASQPSQYRLDKTQADTLLNRQRKIFDDKFNEFKQQYDTDPDFQAKIDDLRNALAKGDWVFMNDKHNDETTFALARLLMEGRDPGKVLLEQPYSLNWDEDMLTGMVSFGNSELGSAIGIWPAVLSQEAIASDWLPVPADAMSNSERKLETEAVQASGVTGYDNQGLTTGGGQGNWVRQNYIGRNVFNEMKDSETGGIVVFGTFHITGSTKSGESALQDIVSTKTHKRTEKITLAKGDSASDYFATVVRKEDLRDDPQYSAGPQMNSQQRTLVNTFIRKNNDLTRVAQKLKTDEATAKEIEIEKLANRLVTNEETARIWIAQLDPNNPFIN